MNQVTKKTDTKEELRQSAVIVNQENNGMDLTDDTILGIIKQIEWESPLNALRLGFNAMSVSVLLSIILFSLEKAVQWFMSAMTMLK